MPGKLLRSMLIGLIVGGLLLAPMPSLRQRRLTLTAQNDTADGPSVSYDATIRCTAPAVVNIYNCTPNSASHNQLTLDFRVIMNQCSYILTNKHVISGADQTIVALQDDRAFKMLLVGSDTLIDLAVLKINTTGGLSVIPINPRHAPHIGDAVLTTDNPYNLGQTTIQEAISATRRIGLNSTGRQNFLQIGTSISHGNSGGASMNPLGEPTGVNTLPLNKSGDGEVPKGIGFMIPLQLATEIMDKLTRDGRVIRGYIGVSGREIAPLCAQGGGINQIQRIMANDVASDGPAAQARIRVNDVIISVNGKPVVSALKTMDQVVEIHPESKIPVVIMHGDKKITLHIAAQEYPVTSQAASRLGSLVSHQIPDRPGI